MDYEVQGEILCTGEVPVPVGISIYCLYLKKLWTAISGKVKQYMTKRKNYLYLFYQALMGNFRVHMKHAIFLHRIFLTAYRTEVVQHSALLELIRAAEREDSACMK